MSKADFTNTHDLMGALATTMNSVSPVVQHHHEQVAYLVHHLACELDVLPEERALVVLAALLHDVGAIFTERPADTLDFENYAVQLAHMSAKLMGGVEPLEGVGDIIYHSQDAWYQLEGMELSAQLKMSAAIVHLADQISTAIDDDKTALAQVPQILAIAREATPSEFCPEVFDAFARVADKPYVWMDLVYHPTSLIKFVGEAYPVSLDATVRLTRFMARLIDFRSPFTAMHSAGVRASAVRLAELMGMSEDECKMMSIAGDLHDLGKVRVPKEILEKPGKLTDEEFYIIQEHAYYTFQILYRVQGFEQISQWAAFHHEKLNGKGYPFRLASHQIGLGVRIMAVADIFSAITEERPYRKGMKRSQIERILRENVETGATCGVVTRMLLENFDDVNAARDAASHDAGGRYFSDLGMVPSSW